MTASAAWDYVIVGAGWAWADVLPWFRRLEHNVRGSNEWHGADGPLWASDIGAKHELIEAIIAAEYRPGSAAQPDADILESAKNTAGTIFHPSGTCRMGAADMILHDR